MLVNRLSWGGCLVPVPVLAANWEGSGEGQKLERCMSIRAIQQLELHVQWYPGSAKF